MHEWRGTSVSKINNVQKKQQQQKKSLLKMTLTVWEMQKLILVGFIMLIYHYDDQLPVAYY